MRERGRHGWGARSAVGPARPGARAAAAGLITLFVAFAARGEVVYEGFREAKAASATTSLTIDTPVGTGATDLLIASVATKDDTAGSLAAPAGWTAIDIGLGQGNKVTLGVWWRLAVASEPSTHQFTWSGNQSAYGWIMRFTGHDTSGPIDAFSTKNGNENSPTSPSVTTTVSNAMILRLGGFEKGDITIDLPGLSGHTAITMDRSGTGGGAASGGAGYVLQVPSGASGTSAFSLTKKRKYRTVTVAIAPVGGADTWIEEIDFGATDIKGIHFASTSLGWAVGKSGKIWHTTDGGCDWAEQTDLGASDLDDVQFLDANTGYIGGKGGKIWKTTDGGSSWTEQTTPSGEDVKAIHFPVDASTGYAVGKKGLIWKTTDGGSNWVAQSSGVNTDLEDVHFPVDASEGWAVGKDGLVLHTADGGASWSAQTTPSNAKISGVHFIDTSTGWAVGNGGAIWTTGDGGANWSAQSSGITTDLKGVQFLNATTGFAIGKSGRILETTDGGAVWSIGSTPDATDGEALHFPSSGFGRAALKSGKIWAYQSAGACSGVAHFSIEHDGSGSTCSAEPVTITAHDGFHATDTAYLGTIALSTSTSNGNWSVISGSGSLVNSGSGDATYSYSVGDAGSVVLGLADSTAETLNIDVTDGSASEDPGEDPDLGFSSTTGIALEETLTATDTDNSVLLPSIQGGSDQTYLLFIGISKAGKDVTGVSGGGLVWTEQKDQCGTHADKAESWVYTAQGSPGSAFQVQIDLDGNTHTSAVLLRYSGVASIEDPTGENAAGESGPCSGPKDAAAQITLTSTTDGSVHVLSVNAEKKTVSSASGGYTNLASLTGNNAKTYVYHQTFASAATDTFQASLSGDVHWATVGVVLVPASSGCGLLDHFAIDHDGNAVNCQAENVTITAHDATHGIDTGYTGTITLWTSSAHGNWSLVSGAGVLVDSGGGSATYGFDATDAGQVVLGLRDTYVETVNIDAVDGSVFESAAEDSDLAFAESGFVFLADGAKNAIGTQIGGKASNLAPGAQNLELQAVRTSDDTGACESFLTGTNTVQMAFECENPTTCTASQLSINGSNVGGTDTGSPLGYTGIALDFGDASDTTATLVLSYPDVGQVQVHARLVLSPSSEEMLGASNSFVVRPFAFDVSASGNPGASGPGGAIFTTAGTDFAASARAVLWSAADDADGDGVADNHDDGDPANNADLTDNVAALNFGQESPTQAVLLAATLYAPSGGNDPGLAGGTTLSSFSGGSATSSAVRYGEVGVVELSAAIASGSYLGIGGVETAKMVGRSGFVGRFTPDHFDVSLNAPVFQTACAAGSYTYLGESFDYATAPEITVTARNAQGTTTANYTGSWFRISGGDLTGLSYAIGSGSLGASAPNAPTVTDLGAGMGLVSFDTGPSQSVDRSAPVAPFEAEIALSANLIDADGVTYAGNPVQFGGTSPGSGIAFSDSKWMRFGRLVLDNAHDSELVTLAVPLHAEYWDGSSFVPHTGDSCTVLTTADLLLTPVPGSIGTTPTIANSPLLSGDAGLSLSPPGLGNSGFFDLEFDLTTATGADRPWLLYDWDGDSFHDDNPTSRATFGVYVGEAPVIYLRELY